MFRNVLDTGRQLIVKGDDVYLITGIGGTLARDDCCAGIGIK